MGIHDDEQREYLDSIKHQHPVGAAHMLMNLATTLALAHGTQIARGLFADIASIDYFWAQIDLMRSQLRPEPARTEPAPIAEPAVPQVERRFTTWEIVDLSNNTIAHTFDTEDTTEIEALNRGSTMMGFPSFAAACRALPGLENRIRARRRGADFEPPLTPAAPAPTAPPAPEPIAEPAAPAELPEPEAVAPVVLGNVHELAGVDAPKKKGRAKGNGAAQ